MNVRFTERDRAVYDAHSAAECDGEASTRQIAELLRLPVSTVARRLVNMQRRGLVVRTDHGMWDDTADWTLTWDGCRAAEAAVSEGTKMARALDAHDAMATL